MKTLGKIFFSLLFFSMGCLDPYIPPNVNQQTDFLVIEGHINSTDNIAQVSITRSVDLTAEDNFPEVSGATVTIEYGNNSKIPLKSTKDGNYSVTYPFDPSVQYRLRVVISGRGYLSEYINLEKNAPIKSIDWSVNEERFEVYANTEDPTPGKKYYRYAFDETFEYKSPFHSSYKFENGMPTIRLPEEEIFICWLTAPSKSIIVATSENLAENIIYKQKIVRIPRGDKRLWRQYSVLVRQYSISKDAYEYWKQIGQTSESVGGLFDPIPYQINGNIRSLSNPNERVLGYFSGGEISEMRLVVKIQELPISYLGNFLGDCDESFVTVSEVASLANLKILLTRAEYNDGPFIVGYYFSSPRCVDCRLDGGTNEKPEFMN